MQILTIHQTDLKHLLEEEDDDDDDDDEDTDEEILDSEEIFAISKAFPDITEQNSYALALLFYDSLYYLFALPEAEKAIETASADPVKKFQATELLARIHYELEKYETAYSTIKSALSDTSNLSPALLRSALVTRGKIESVQSLGEEAAASYEAARQMLPDVPMLGKDLQQQFASILSNKKGDNAAIIDVVKSWTPLERLTWATWKYDSEEPQHQYFQRACGREGKIEFMISTYKEIIHFLDAVDSGAPMRLEFAHAQWNVCGDLAAAKQLVDEILETESDGSDYRFTGQDSAWTMVQTIDFMSDILYEQFRTTADPKRKAEIIEEMKTLTSKPLPQSISSWKSMANHHKLVLARMIKKTGPISEYQDLLQELFDVCYESLTDNVGWNDTDNLRSLALVLSVMGGFEKEARTLLSAIFSVLDKSLDEQKGEESNAEEEDGKDGENDDHADEEGADGDGDGDDIDDAASDATTLPTDEGDLIGDNWFVCDGECPDNTTYRAWAGRTLYFCTICTDITLCEPCFQKRQAYNEGSVSPRAEVGAAYCGNNHRYLKGPIEGWKGVKDGALQFEGEESVPFGEWLETLKEVKWKKAWEDFWLRED